jgi:lysophospholipase L1-like esterase
MELKGLKINFLGDSITEGVGTSAPCKMFHAVLKDEAGLEDVRNYGIGGTRFAVQKDCEWREWNPVMDENSFSERYDKMDDDADVVVVFGGTNDYGHGDAPLGSFNDKTPDTFYGACHYLFSGLINKYPGKPIVVMTPLHRCNEYDKTAGVKTKEYATLKEYVYIIKEVAQYYSLPVLDLYASSGIQPEVPVLKEMFMPDGLHPNDEGNKIIAHKLKIFLENL